MNALPYPRGAARAIAQARANGLRPSTVVLVVLAGRLDWPNPQVYVTPFQRYRWDWLKGLSVVVIVDSSTRLDNILQDIESAAPSQLDVIDHERRLGWQVQRTSPRLEKVRWPRPWVEDWLGNQAWHQELSDIKSCASHLIENQRLQVTSESEVAWS